jgi:hypothetical protein
MEAALASWAFQAESGAIVLFKPSCNTLPPMRREMGVQFHG